MQACGKYIYLDASKKIQEGLGLHITWKSGDIALAHAKPQFLKQSNLAKAFQMCLSKCMCLFSGKKIITRDYCFWRGLFPARKRRMNLHQGSEPAERVPNTKSQSASSNAQTWTMLQTMVHLTVDASKCLNDGSIFWSLLLRLRAQKGGITEPEVH